MANCLEECPSYPFTESTSVSGWTQAYSLELSNSVLQPRAAYELLDPVEVENRRVEALQKCASVLGINEDVALRLLRKYKWNGNHATEQWFSNQELVKEALGLGTASCSTVGQECPVCFTAKELCMSSCGHALCSDCWSGFIKAGIDQGPSCLDLRCPIADCVQSVPNFIITRTAATEDIEKLQDFSRRSFINDNPQAAWCPGANCGRVAFSVESAIGMEPLDVYCDCGQVSCFYCHKEGHRPVDCDMVREWMGRASSSLGLEAYFLAHTKPCPGCRITIEKNQGCMHMTCSQCNHDFCWLCLGDWSNHGDATGGYYQCNIFAAQVTNGTLGEEEQERQRARLEVERYEHYMGRYTSHENSQAEAVRRRDASLSDIEDIKDRISKEAYQQQVDLLFLGQAWNQIIECRRILKYSYVYGFYTYMDDTKKHEKFFFEFIQGDAENSLDRLHHEVEQFASMINITHLQNQGYFRKRDSEEETLAEIFNQHEKSIDRLTSVTRNFFVKLVEQLEKGVGRIGSQELSIQESLEIPQPSLQEATEAVRRLEQEQGFWICNVCTFGNTDLGLEECAMCQSVRGTPAPIMEEGAPPVEDHQAAAAGENAEAPGQADLDADQPQDPQPQVAEDHNADNVIVNHEPGQADAGQQENGGAENAADDVEQQLGNALVDHDPGEVNGAAPEHDPAHEQPDNADVDQ